MSDADQMEMTLAGLRVGSAGLYVDARVKDYEGTVLSGSKQDVAQARDDAVAAFEAMLDLKFIQGCLVLKAHGVDHTARRDGPEPEPA